MSKEPKDKRTKAWKEWDKARNKKPVKLGDVVEKITKKTGIKKVVELFTPEGEDCGCNKRREWLNQFEFTGRKHKALRCLTEEQYKDYGYYIKNRTLDFRPDLQMLIDLYVHVFAIQYNPRDFGGNCNGCAKRLKEIQEKLDFVYHTYEKADGK